MVVDDGTLARNMRLPHDRRVDAPKDEATVRAGEAIRSARLAKGWNQTRLRDVLREAMQIQVAPGEEETVGQSAVSRWENGVHAPERWRWRVIEEVLDIPAGSLAQILLGADASNKVEPSAAARLDELEARIERLEGKVDVLPQAVAIVLGDRRLAERHVRKSEPRNAPRGDVAVLNPAAHDGRLSRISELSKDKQREIEAMVDEMLGQE